MLLTACSSVFFYPKKKHISTPSGLGLHYQDVYLTSQEGMGIHGWFLPAVQDSLNQAQGTVYFLHGNAENISTHIHNVRWLPSEGYNVFLIDYRGFGLSQGSPSVAGALDDIRLGFQWLLENEQVDNQSIFLLGQSLGASLGLYFSATDPLANQYLRGVVSDAGFTRYRDIAKHVANGHWLTWLFQYPLSWSVVRDFDAIDVVDKIAPIPILFIQSRDDRIIPYSYAEMLYEKSKQPKMLFTTRGPHTATFKSRRNQLQLIEFFEGKQARN